MLNWIFQWILDIISFSFFLVFNNIDEMLKPPWIKLPFVGFWLLATANPTWERNWLLELENFTWDDKNFVND